MVRRTFAVTVCVLAACSPTPETPHTEASVVIEPANDDTMPEPVIARAATVASSTPPADPSAAPRACGTLATTFSPAGNGLPTSAGPAVQIALPGPFTFRIASGELNGTSPLLIDLVAGHLAAHPEVTLLRIEAHSDSHGAEASNMALTQERAFSIACALRAAGIDCKRLLPVGFGESRPIGPNETAAGRAQNRRVELYHAAVGGNPVGARPLDGGGVVAGDPCR